MAIKAEREPLGAAEGSTQESSSMRVKKKARSRANSDDEVSIRLFLFEASLLLKYYSATFY